MDKQYEVFISFKNTDIDGKETYECQMADELYTALSNRGCKVFYSRKSLSIIGTSQYKYEIDKALDDASVLIVVGTSKENITSNWVRYEWDSFYNDILNGNKSKKLFSYIYNMDTSELPRTLRQLQSFEKGKMPVEKISDYIYNAIHHENTNIIAHREINNLDTYSYQDERESERLSSQAKLVCNNDISLLSPLIEELSHKKKINILDIGCADGYLTKVVFENFKDKIHCLIGIDRDNGCITIANGMGIKNFHFYSVELENSSFEEEMLAIMKKEGIESFDLVFSALVLHHLNYPVKFLRKIRKYMSDDGIGYFRSCDDDEIISYPDEKNILKNTLQDFALIDGISDRKHGRKLYSEVYNAGFNKIDVKSYYITTACMNIDERLSFFFDIFYWRKNKYKRLVDIDPENSKTMSDYLKFCDNYDELEERFYDHSYYFMCSGPIVICKK